MYIQGVNSSSTAYKESDQIGFSGLLGSQCRILILADIRPMGY